MILIKNILTSIINEKKIDSTNMIHLPDTYISRDKLKKYLKEIYNIDIKINNKK